MDSEICVFCNTNEEDLLNLGELCETEGYSAHYLCVLLANDISQSGNDDEGVLGFLYSDIIEKIETSAAIKCSYCNNNGATIACSRTQCNINFHLPCGIKNNASHQFYGQYLSHCCTHRPRQSYPMATELCRCVICLEEVNFTDWKNILWAPCCKQSNFFHKICLQNLALSAGFFFKCPCCNDSRIFNSTMEYYGIYIPDRDASWEREPGAYQELLYRHTECNVKRCLNKQSRYVNNPGRWSIILCATCGSKGTHAYCSNLKRKDMWLCNDCALIAPKKTIQKQLYLALTASDSQASTTQQFVPASSSSTSCMQAVSVHTASNSSPTNSPAWVRMIRAPVIYENAIPGPSTVQTNEVSQINSVTTLSSESSSVSLDCEVEVVSDDDDTVIQVDLEVSEPTTAQPNENKSASRKRHTNAVKSDDEDNKKVAPNHETPIAQEDDEEPATGQHDDEDNGSPTSRRVKKDEN